MTRLTRRVNNDAALREICGDQPNAQQENYEPSIIETHRNPEDVRDRDLAFRKID